MVYQSDFETSDSISLYSDYQPPNVILQGVMEDKFPERFYTGSYKFKSIKSLIRKDSNKADRLKIHELKQLDADLNKGKIIYLLMLCTACLIVNLVFLFLNEQVLPSIIRIFRVLLAGFFIYGLMKAITALRSRSFESQSLIVYNLKWFALFSVIDSALGLALFNQNIQIGNLVGHSVKVILILSLLEVSRYVESILKRREELLSDITFNNFFL